MSSYASFARSLASAARTLATSATSAASCASRSPYSSALALACSHESLTSAAETGAGNTKTQQAGRCKAGGERKARQAPRVRVSCQGFAHEANAPESGLAPPWACVAGGTRHQQARTREVSPRRHGSLPQSRQSRRASLWSDISLRAQRSRLARRGVRAPPIYAAHATAGRQDSINTVSEQNGTVSCASDQSGELIRGTDPGDAGLFPSPSTLPSRV